jgi:hypothetical protein
VVTAAAGPKAEQEETGTAGIGVASEVVGSMAQAVRRERAEGRAEEASSQPPGRVATAAEESVVRPAVVRPEAAEYAGTVAAAA